MRILVIGGTRFIGRHLVEELLRRNDEVTIASRGRAVDPFGTTIERILCDRFDREALVAALSRGAQWDAVVDFLGFTAENVDDLLLALGNEPGHVILISSSAVSEHEERAVLGEEDACHEGVAPSAEGYALGKWLAEARLRQEVHGGGLHATILRLPIVQGPWDYTLRSWRYQLWLQSGRPVDLPGGGRQRISFVFRDDAVRGILACLEKGGAVAGETFNLAQPPAEAPTLRGYLEEMARCLETKPVFREVPLSGYPHMDWHPYATSSAANHVLDTSRASSLISWDPLPMAQWLSATCSWFDGPENPFEMPADPPWLLGG